MKHKLDELDKKHGFEVPERYFEELPLKIQAVLKGGNSVARSERKYRLSLVAGAAFLVLIATLTFVLLPASPTPEDMLAQVSEEAMLAYLVDQELEIHEIKSVISVDTDLLEEADTDLLNGISMEKQALEDVLQEYNLAEESL